MTIISDPDKIQGVRLLALRGMLSLEAKGMKRSRGPSAATIVKREFGLRGTNAKVLADFESILRDRGILR
jgi:hypothetical protein